MDLNSIALQSMHSTTTHSPTTQKAADLMSAAFTINMII